MSFFDLFRSKKTKSVEMTSTEKKVEEVYLLVFSASWCNPSNLFKKELNQAGVNYSYVDVDQCADLAVEYDIEAVPTTFLLDKNKQQLHRWDGYDDEDPGQTKLVNIVKKYKIIPYPHSNVKFFENARNKQIDLKTCDFDMVIDIQEKGVNTAKEVKALMHIIDVYSEGNKKLSYVDLTDFSGNNIAKMQYCDFGVRGKRYFFCFVVKNGMVQDYLLEKVMPDGYSKLIAAKNTEMIGSPEYVSMIGRAEMAEQIGIRVQVSDWIYK